VANGEVSGWKSLGNNNPTQFQATFNYNNGNIDSSGQQGKDGIVVITDRSDGDYDVYKKTFFGDKLIYQYNAASNETTIKNQADYNKFFTGKNTQQYTNLTKGVKKATLDLSAKFATTATGRREYAEMQEREGYKSLANTQEQPTSLDSQNAALSGEGGQGNGSSDNANGTTDEQFISEFNSAFGDDLYGGLYGNLDGNPFAGFGTIDEGWGGAGFTDNFGIDYQFNQDFDLSAAPPADNVRSSEYSGESMTNPAAGAAAGAAAQGTTLKYPEADLTNFGYDYIQITGHKYTTKNAGGFNAFGKGKGASNISSFADYQGVKSKFGDVTRIVQLPMQPNLSEASAVDWTENSINEIQRRGAGLAADTITNIRNDAGSAIGNFLSSAGETAQALIKDPNLGSYFTALFAGQAVGANIVARTTGSVLNQNLELLFKGPKLRQFSFNFALTPRSDGEAKVIREMIRFFKKSMAPARSSARIFLYTPDIFELKYIHNGGGQHPYMNLIKPCALTNFGVNYTPASSYMTYKDGSMTQYEMSMTFAELEPIYQDDQDNVGGTGY
jgi:hypothetical protein